MITCVFTLVCDVWVTVTRPIASSSNHRWGIALQSWLQRDGPLVELSVEIEFLLRWRTSKDNWRSAFRWQVSQDLQGLCPLQEVLHESLKQTSFQQNPELQKRSQEIRRPQKLKTHIDNFPGWLWADEDVYDELLSQVVVLNVKHLEVRRWQHMYIFYIDLVDITSQQEKELSRRSYLIEVNLNFWRPFLSIESLELEEKM